MLEGNKMLYPEFMTIAHDYMSKHGYTVYEPSYHQLGNKVHVVYSSEIDVCGFPTMYVQGSHRCVTVCYPATKKKGG